MKGLIYFFNLLKCVKLNLSSEQIYNRSVKVHQLTFLDTYTLGIVCFDRDGYHVVIVVKLSVWDVSHSVNRFRKENECYHLFLV